MTRSVSRSFLVILAFAVLYLVWGSTYLVVLFGLKDLPPFLLMAGRFGLAGALLVGWCVLNRERLSAWSSVGKNAISGILMLCGGTGSVIWAEQFLPSGLVATLVAVLPFWFVLFDKPLWPLYFAQKLSMAGLVLNFVGVCMLMSGQTPAATTSTHTGLVPVLVVLMGGICWTVGSLYSKYRPNPGSTALNGGTQLLLAGGFALLISLWQGEPAQFTLQATTTGTWMALAYMVFAETLIGYSAYLWLLTVRPPTQVGTYAYVNPAVAVLLGWAFAGEHISSGQIAALLLILIGVFLVNLPQYKRTAAVPLNAGAV